MTKYYSDKMNKAHGVPETKGVKEGSASRNIQRKHDHNFGYVYAIQNYGRHSGCFSFIALFSSFIPSNSRLTFLFRFDIRKQQEDKEARRRRRGRKRRLGSTQRRKPLEYSSRSFLCCTPCTPRTPSTLYLLNTHSHCKRN